MQELFGVARRAVILALSLLGGLALGQAYPSRPITIIVPWAAGGGTDLVARALATVLQKELGQPVQVVNRTGGGGVVGHLAIAQARPDGYTVGMGTVEITMLHWMGVTPLTYRDFTPIALVNYDAAAITVRKDAPWNSLEDFIADVRRNPGRYKASGTARGGIWDLARAGFLKALGLPESAIPWVPSQGASPALQELLAGGVDVVFNSLAEVSALLKAGQVKTLAVMAENRNPEFPDIPTLKERGINWTIGAWRGIMGPKGMPPAAVNRLEAAIAKAVQDPEFIALLKPGGFGIRYLSRQEFAHSLEQEDKKMGELLKAVGLAK